MRVKYSVVIRTHNETEELIKSIKSVQAQTFNDWELIIVDDGSIETTAQIAEEQANQDSRIRVIHQDNQGGLGALRRGIKEAEGQYLAFLDAGDVYDCDYLEAANRIFDGDEKEIDMVLFGLREIFPDHDEEHFLATEKKILTPKELLIYMERTVSFYGLALRVTRREVFSFSREEELFYDRVGKSGNYGDDLYLLTPILRNCRKIYVSSKPLYGYVYNEGSLSHFFPSYTWGDAWNRNRLVGFTYRTVKDCGWMDEEMEMYLRKHAVTLLAPCAKWIVRHHVRDRKIQRQFRNDSFFRQVVACRAFGKDELPEMKSRFAMNVFCLLVAFFS